MGFVPHTTQNIQWYNVNTHKVKNAGHVRFDEGMNDLPYHLAPPNPLNLQYAKNNEPFPTKHKEIDAEDKF